MVEIVELLGPDAVRNLLQNWPFAGMLLYFAWLMWRRIESCYARLESITDRLLDKELKD